MVKALVLTTWIGDGKTPETAFRPAVSPKSWSNVTGTEGKAAAEVVIEANDDAAEIAKLPAVLWKEGDAPEKRTAALAKIAGLKAAAVAPRSPHLTTKPTPE